MLKTNTIYATAVLSLVLGNSIPASHAEPLNVSREPATSFSTDPSESVLLLGDPTVVHTTNLTQRFFPAQKHPSNPVMRRSEPWEGVGPYVWGNRLMQDERTGMFRLWYTGFRHKDNHYRWGYATSPDGLNWTKPDLGVERFEDALTRNCLPLGPHPEKGARSIARDPRPETPSDRRYLGVRFTYEGEFVSFSPDGITWVEYPMNPVWHVPADIIHVMWDERRQRFIAYYKDWELNGQQIVSGGPRQGRPFTAFMSSFTTNDLGNGTTEFEGPCITFRPPDEAKVERRKFVLRSDNQGADDGGGTSLTGAWTSKRVQVFAESVDGIHWTNEQVVMRADANDPPSANIQYMFVMPYGGYYLGFLTLHDEEGYFRIQLAWSEDAISWQRPWRKPWLDVGPEGTFDCGMVLGPGDPIFNEREMWFPYGGFTIRHDSKKRDWNSAIGLAITRLDGFAGWEAGDKAGELVTQTFRCKGDRLFVNADAHGGSVAVEVLDEHGAPIEGFEADSCKAITTDTLVTQDNGRVSWENGADLSRLQDQPISLRFVLNNAQLFSFRIADEASKDLPVPRATTQ